MNNLCRCCNYALEVKHQPHWRPGERGSDLLTCCNRACPLYGHTFDSRDYSGVELAKYTRSSTLADTVNVSESPTAEMNEFYDTIFTERKAFAAYEVMTDEQIAGLQAEHQCLADELARARAALAAARALLERTEPLIGMLPQDSRWMQQFPLVKDIWVFLGIKKDTTS